MAEKKSSSKKKVQIQDLPKTKKRVDRVPGEQAEKIKGGVLRMKTNDDPTHYG